MYLICEGVCLINGLMFGVVGAAQVSFQVYGYYLRAVGVLSSVMTVIFYVLSQGCSVGSNLWLSKWSEAYAENDTMADSDRDMYLGVYASFGIGQGKYSISHFFLPII